MTAISLLLLHLKINFFPLLDLLAISDNNCQTNVIDCMLLKDGTLTIDLEVTW